MMKLLKSTSSEEVLTSPSSTSWPMQRDKVVELGSSLSDSEIMKERFSKLLLGEDMTGCGNGVCPALAISNAITNLSDTLFGQVWRLEPLSVDKKLAWRREIGWLVSASDHIVELVPSWQTFSDGSKLEVMMSRPRSDLYVNLPALRKLDNMLLEILDGFEGSEFWYVDQSKAAKSSSIDKPLTRRLDKWWLPVPRVPPGGLSEDTKRILQHKRDCTNQILKAAMAINGAVLAEMSIPDSYLEALPKNGKTSLGDIIHRYINSDQFSPEYLLDCLDLASDHHALEIANRVEAAVCAWRRKMTSSKSSWGLVKDLVSDADKGTQQLAARGESLLVCLKRRYPALPHTTLDTTKIQCNEDVGKSILESYSRVLGSVAFNIVARIDDLVYVDELSKNSNDHFMSISKFGVITRNSIAIAPPLTGSPYRTGFSTCRHSPLVPISPAKGDKSPYIESSKRSLHGFGLRRTSTDCVNGDGRRNELRSRRRLGLFSP